jgi:twinkle protein
MTDELEEGELLGHYACVGHGGSDSLALYQHEDGIRGYCFAECGAVSAKTLKKWEVTDGKDEVLVEPAIITSSKGGSFVMTDEVLAKVNSILEKETHGWPERRIPAIVNDFYGVRSDVEGSGRDKVLLKEYCPSYDQNDDLVGWHVRDDKCKKARNEGQKDLPQPFYSIGKVRGSCKMFGQNKFEKGGKYLVIASGQADARAIFTALNTENDHQTKRTVLKKFLTPIVSVQTGEGSMSQIKSNYEWISSFENVVIMYDQDDAGKEGAEKLAKLLKPGQAKIAKYKRKDACDHSKRGEWDAIRQAFWKAESFSPIDICSLGQLWDEFEHAVEDDIIELPKEYRTLGGMMGGGFRAGQITMLLAYTSVGKSTHLNRIAYDAAIRQGKKVGLVYLESSPRELVEGFLSIHSKTNLTHLRREEMNMGMLKNQFQDMIGKDDNILSVNHHGSFTSVDDMFNKIRWLIKAMGSQLVLIDPLQQAVPNNENQVVEEFMDKLLKLVKETGAHIIVVSHMKKPSDTNPHNVDEYGSKGSSAINQVAFNSILISRDKTHDNAKVRNATKLTLVKNRTLGITGDAGWVSYNPDTTEIKEVANPYDSLDEPDETLFGGDVDVGEQDYDKVEEQESSQDWEVVDE